MTVKIIDLETMNELVEIMGEDMTMLIDSYIADTRAKLAQLAELQPSTEHESIFRLAHSLKGSSRNIGVSAFADYCEIIEEQARAQQLNANGIDLQELSRLFESAIDAIQQQLSQSPNC
jgi:histidine phosphotransfer protein HptB